MLPLVHQNHICKLAHPRPIRIPTWVSARLNFHTPFTRLNFISTPSANRYANWAWVGATCSDWLQLQLCRRCLWYTLFTSIRISSLLIISHQEELWSIPDVCVGILRLCIFLIAGYQTNGRPSPLLPLAYRNCLLPRPRL